MLGNGVRVAAGQLADNHATSGAFADIDMVVTRRPRGDQLQLRMVCQKCCINSGGDKNAENFSIDPNLSCLRWKPQIMFGQRGLEEIFLGLLRLSEGNFHGDASALKPRPSTVACLHFK